MLVDNACRNSSSNLPSQSNRRVLDEAHHLRQAAPGLPDRGVRRVLQHPALAYGAGSPAACSRGAGGSEDAGDGSGRGKVVRRRAGEIVRAEGCLASQRATDKYLQLRFRSDQLSGNDVLLGESRKEDFTVSRPIAIVRDVDCAVWCLKTVGVGNTFALVEHQAALPCLALIF